MTCKTYMKTSVLALIDTEKPVGNSTNYMELESNISVHENSYLVSLRMWTPLRFGLPGPNLLVDMDPLYTPYKTCFVWFYLHHVRQ